ncbi:MAG: hypothetical protein ABIC04_04010 [Nanoarchaeota archaeon]
MSKEEVIKNAVEKLNKDYEKARIEENKAQAMLANYKKLHDAEKAILKSKNDQLQAVKLKADKIREELKIAEEDFEEEKLRLIDIENAEQKAGQDIKTKNKQTLEIAEHIKDIIEEENSVKAAKNKYNKIRQLYDNAKMELENAKNKAEAEIKKTLKSEGVQRVTKAHLEKAKTFIDQNYISKDLEQEIKTDEMIRKDLEKEELLDKEIQVDEKIIEEDTNLEDLQKLNKDLEQEIKEKKKEEKVIDKDLNQKKEEGSLAKKFLGKLKQKVLPSKEDDLEDLEKRFKDLDD